MGFFGITLPSLPTLSLPKVTLPKISLPKITLPSLPKVSLPSLPSISLPKVSLPAINLPAGVREGTKAAQKYIEEQRQRAIWAAEAAAEAAASAGRAISSVPKVSIPVISIPKVEIPKIDIPKVTPPTIAIPKVTLPNLPKVEIPKIALLDLPKISGLDLVKGIGSALPVAGAATGAGAVVALAGANPIGAFGADVLGAIQRGEMPVLPDVGKAVSGAAGAVGGAVSSIPLLSPPKADLRDNNETVKTVSGLADTVIDARDKNYEDGLIRAVAGETPGEKAAGVAQFGGTMAMDVMLPLDLVNVTNKFATGRGDELTGEDYLYAGIDAASIALGALTGGIGYVAVRGAVKGGKIGVKSLKGGGELFKASKVASAITAARKVSRKVKIPTRTRPKVTKAGSSTPSGVSGTGLKAGSSSPPGLMNTKRYVTGYQAKTPAIKPSAPVYKAPESVKVESVKVESAKLPEMPTKPSALGSAGKTVLYGATGLGIGYAGLQAVGALSSPLPGDGEDPYFDPYAGYTDPYGGLPAGTLPGGEEMPGGYWWDYPGGEGEIPEGGGYPEPYYPPGSDDPYYPPSYPGGEWVEPAEYFAQDVGGFLEGLPFVGDLFAEANRRGLALPVLLGGCLLIGGGGYYVATRTKAGRRAAAQVSKTVKGVIPS